LIERPLNPTRFLIGGVALIAILITWGQASDAKSLTLATTALIYCLACQGLNFQYGVAGYLSIAQGAVWGSGAYVAALGASKVGMSIWVAFPIAIVVAAVFALLIGAASLRVTGNYYVIVTFAIATIFDVTMSNLNSLTGGTQGISISQPVGFLGPINLNSPRGIYYLTGVICLAGIGAAYALHSSKWAERLRVASANIELARSLGISVRPERFGAFAVAGVFAGIAGVLYAFQTSYVEPDIFGTSSGILFVLVVILGGSGTVLGPLVGACFVVFLPDLLPFSPYADQVVYGLILVVVVLVIPRGIVGSVEALLRHIGSVGFRKPRSGGSPTIQKTKTTKIQSDEAADAVAPADSSPQMINGHAGVVGNG
jgi:branched-chain amino acid transport system permease protein